MLVLNITIYIIYRVEELNKKSAKEKLEYLKDKFPHSKILFKVLNFHDNNSITNFFQDVEKDFKSVDILINNAMYGIASPVDKMSFAEFEDGLNGVLSSTFKCCRLVLPLMKKEKKGAIINIASMYGIVAPDWRIYQNNDFDNPVNYGAAKAGIIQLTRYLASYWAKYGIRVNSISPGSFPQEEVIKDTEFHNFLENKTMLGRIGTPEDIKGIIALLASDSSNYITGQNFIIDGGWTAW